MKLQYSLFKRSGVYYCQDTTTGKQTSLRTKDEGEAATLLSAKNEATRQSGMNLQIAQVYLQHGDPTLAKRTWQDVMEAMAPLKSGPTLVRWNRAIRDAAFDSLHGLKLTETTAAHFLKVLKIGTVSTNMFLRRIHNFAVDMHWLPWPVLPKRQWPRVKHGDRRAITADEHARIIARERNPEHRAYYELVWHVGGSQSDVASLHGEDVDWKDRTVTFNRCKNEAPVILSFGEEAAALLQQLPKSGPLFPKILRTKANHRAKTFIRRLKSVGITGVSLHSYRYSWAERARAAGMPERFAQQALGHGSKAVSRAYSKKAIVKVPALEEYEKKIIPMPTAAAA